MNAKEKFPWLFLALAFGINWLLLLPGILASWGLFTLPIPIYALVAVAQFGPSLAAFILASREGGRAAMGRLFRRGLAWRIPAAWLALILLLPSALAAAALGINVLCGGRAPALPLLAQPLSIPINFVIIFFMYGALPEEFGWRGYLLDRLQARWSPLAASLALGGLWWLWHLPAAWMNGVAQAYLPQAPYLAWILGFTVLMTWVYNRTGRNLLAAMLFHASANLSFQLFPPVELVPGADPRGFAILAALTLLVAGLVVLAWKPIRSRRAVEASPTGSLEPTRSSNA